MLSVFASRTRKADSSISAISDVCPWTRERASLFLSLSHSIYVQKWVTKREHIGETTVVWKRIAQRTKKSLGWRRTAIKATRGTFTVYL